MKKVVKLILLAVAFMVAGTTNTILASEVAFQNGITVEVQSPYSSEYNGKLFTFNTLQDKEMFDDFKAQERLRHYNPIQTRVTHIRTVNLGRKWVNYNPLTPNWSKASSYNMTVSNTVTASGTFSYQGASFGISASLSRGVSINIPANPNRFSRLGFEADVQMEEYKIEHYDITNANKVFKTTYSKVPVVKNTYNVVRYQN